MSGRLLKARGNGGRAHRLWSVVLLGLLLGACRDASKASGTALFVTIDFPTTLFIDQLVVSGSVGESGIGPYVLPGQPERLLTNGETFRILLPPVENETPAEVNVEGLHEGARVALGTGSVQIRKGYEVELTVRMESAPPVDPTFCVDCPSGCCMNGYCTRSTFQTCGTGGISCTSCNPATANACSEDGFCACGSAPACDPIASDRCDKGKCRCGGKDACPSGLQCVGGQCQCTPESCSGCCDGNTCVPGNQREKCGSGGQGCRSCGFFQCKAGGTCG
ncbi:hypothetical protein SAMN05444354_11536 [Stigmatella aurantiaca]|uniref:Uncharacterized protein n=1 Tax=Stigmatella aurantiaca TaxID=41 RepID=A0A1H7XKD0_STIAU|nr:hypothetical protein SAMN05444354_11536 [Stigmatella aurantiaca]